MDKGRLGLKINQVALGEQEPQTPEQLAAKMPNVGSQQILPVDCTPIHVEVKAKRKSDGGIDEWDEVYIVPMYWSNEEVDEYLSPRLRQAFEDVKDRYVSLFSGWKWTER